MTAFATVPSFGPAGPSGAARRGRSASGEQPALRGEPRFPPVMHLLRAAAGLGRGFLSADNRTLARSARTCPDVESCLASIRILREGLPRAVGETTRNGNGQWVS